MSDRVPCPVTGPGARGCPGAEEEEGERDCSCSCSQSLCPSRSWEVAWGAHSGDSGGQGQLPSPLLQGPVPFVWPNRGTRLSRSWEQLQPSSLPHSGWASPAPSTVPSPPGDNLGPREEIRACHRTEVAPHPCCHQHLPTASSMGGTGLRVQPSLPFLVPFPAPVPSPSLSIPIPSLSPLRAPCPAGRRALCLSQIPNTTGRWLPFFSCLFCRLRSPDRLFLNARGNC